MVGDTFEFLIQLVLEYRNGSAPIAHVHDNTMYCQGMSRFVHPSQTRAKQEHALTTDPISVLVALAILYRVSNQLLMTVSAQL